MVCWMDMTFRVEIAHKNLLIYYENGSKTEQAIASLRNQSLTVRNHRMTNGNSNSSLPDMG